MSTNSPKEEQMDSEEAVAEERRNQKFTLLKRWGGCWSQREIGALSKLEAVSARSDFPEFVILYGEVSRKAIMDTVGRHFKRSVVTGFDNPKLPYAPAM